MNALQSERLLLRLLQRGLEGVYCRPDKTPRIPASFHRFQSKLGSGS
jgi:hypothetical protein